VRRVVAFAIDRGTTRDGDTDLFSGFNLRLGVEQGGHN
jgi:hypothetical protein